MSNSALTRNMFTEKLFAVIEEPWSNESTPSSTPAKKSRDAHKFMNTGSIEHDPNSSINQESILDLKVTVGEQSWEDEPDFIVWKLAEKLFALQCRRHCLAAFKEWVIEFKRSSKSKRMSQKAKILNRRKLQLKMFNSWYGSAILVSGSSKKKMALTKFLQTKTKKELLSIFGRFKQATLSLFSLDVVKNRFRCRLLRACIDLWCNEIAICAINYTKSLKMSYKICLRTSLRSWKKYSVTKRRREVVLRIFERRCIRKRMVVCFKCWNQSKQTSLMMPSKNSWLVNHLEFHKRKQITMLLKEWKRASVHLRQARLVLLKSICRVMFSGNLTYASWCVKNSMIIWVENTHKARKKPQTKQAHSLTNVTIGTIFKRWAACSVVDQRANSIAKRHRRLKTITMLKRCYQIWKSVMRTFHAAKHKSDMVIKSRSMHRKLRVFMIWRQAQISLAASALLKADSHRISCLNRKQILNWNKWKQRTMRRITLERSFKSRARSRISVCFCLRSFFWEWKMSILSEQFCKRYVMIRIWNMWKISIQKNSRETHQDEKSKDSNRIPLHAITNQESASLFMIKVYDRKLLSNMLHGWAWICSQRSNLLEKLQIAFMIRSSIRTCRVCFTVWSSHRSSLKPNEDTTQEKQLTAVTSQIQTHDAEQRMFEILNIALVERIFWCNISKTLQRKTLKKWCYITNECRKMRNIAILQNLKQTFNHWNQHSVYRTKSRVRKQLLCYFTSWKYRVRRKGAIEKACINIQATRFQNQKRLALFAWFKHTFGNSKPFHNISETGQAGSANWKILYCSFHAWYQWQISVTARSNGIQCASEAKIRKVTMIQHFEAWKAIWKISKSYKSLTKSKEYGKMSRVFKAWSRCTFVQKKANSLITSLQNYQSTALLILCWNAWRAGFEQRNYRSLTLSVTGKLIQKCNAVSVQVRIAWNGWRNFISTRRFVRLAKEKIAHKVYERASFRNMFRKWRVMSSRRKKISDALSKVRNTVLRRAFFAIKYCMVRTVFFARQYQRLSKRCKNRCKNEKFQENLKSDGQMNRESPISESRPDINLLQERVLELQSEKIDLMEQLKSALQEKQRDSCSPVTNGALKKEPAQSNLKKTADDIEMDKKNANHDMNQSAAPVRTLPHVFPTQHPLFPVQSQTRGLTSLHSGRASHSSSSTQQERPTFASEEKTEHAKDYSTSESDADSDHDQYFNGIIDDDGESDNDVDDVYGVSARPKTANRVNFKISESDSRQNITLNSNSRPLSGKRPHSGKKSTPYGSLKVDVSSSRPKSAVYGEASVSNGRLKTPIANESKCRPISASSGIGLRPISAKSSVFRERDANIQQFHQWNDSMRVSGDQSKAKSVQCNGDQYFKERMEQVSRLQSKLLGALQTSASVTSPMVDRQRASKKMNRPGFAIGSGNRYSASHMDGLNIERVVYNPEN